MTHYAHSGKMIPKTGGTNPGKARASKMTKVEVIKSTGYTEEQLILLGLIAMKNRMKEARSESTDSESFDHYDRLVRAYDKMIVEREDLLK